METGSRGAKPLKKLWARIAHLKPFAVATDEWKVYRKIRLYAASNDRIIFRNGRSSSSAAVTQSDFA